MTRILVADHDEDIRKEIKHHLTLSGYRVLEASAGQEALEMLQKHQVALLLLESSLPDMEGLEMLRKMHVRGDEVGSIMITDTLDSKLVAECMQHGLSDFIIKPLKSDELIKKVEKVAGPVEGNEADAGYDILLVDDGARVPDAFRGELPDVFSVFAATNREEAMALCGEHEFKLIIVDAVIPDENSDDLAIALREKVPDARVAALYPRKVKYPGIRASEKGYDGFLVKPFVNSQITAVLNPDGVNSADQPVLVRSDTLLQVRQPSEADPAEVFTEASKGILSAIEELAADCCDEVILDLRQMPQTDGFSGFIEETMQHCMNVCIDPKVIGPSEMGKLLPEGTPLFSCVTDILDG